MTRLSRVLIVLCLVLAAAGTASAASFTFKTLPPDGAIVGMAGETVGWGYEITNDSADYWLWLVDLQAPAGFQHGTPDASIFDFPVLEPKQTLTVPYDGIFGLYQFTWDAGVPLGFVNQGEFELTGSWYDGDPYQDGTLANVEPFTASAPYQVTAVPEPTSMLLLGTGLVGAVRAARRKRG